MIPSELTMDLVYKIIKVIEKEKLIVEGDRVLLGASGGIDSTSLAYVLLEVTRKIPFELGLAHVNHQLRGEESARDADFVKTMAGRFSLPYFGEEVDVKAYAAMHALSLQHAGRDVRYRFFEKTAETCGYNRIAIAHNLDDQVETFLLRLLKGTGIRGLSSIPLKRGRIIRPFLYIERQEIEAYATAHGIPFVVDSSNLKATYERNFVRKHLVPVMERLNPAFREKVFSLLQDLTPVNEVFDNRAEVFLREQAIEEDGDVFLRVAELTGLDPETRFRVVSRIISAMAPGFIPLREHMRLVEKIVVGQKPNLAAVLPHGIKVRRVYKRLLFTTKPVVPPTEGIFPVSPGENRLDSFMLSVDAEVLPHGRPRQLLEDRYTAYFDADKLGDLQVRAFQDGDRFTPLGMSHQVKVKNFFMAQKIPKEQRRHIPLFLSDTDIIWVVGYRIDDRYKVDDSTTRVLKITVKMYQ
jgi:tRNA(Ile)-lysidine synthase